jgi:diguanylate cyclase (GGDEF)-like protein
MTSIRQASPFEPDAPAVATTWVTLLSIWSIVFAASLIGIVTRPEGFFSAFWPANPLLLGLMLRYQPYSRPASWVAAGLGYVAADLATGSLLLNALWLNGVNLLGVAAGWLVLRKLDKRTLQFRRHRSALYVFVASAAAALVGAAFGGPAGPVLFNAPYITTTVLWFAGELMNFMLLLPVILTAPTQWRNLRKPQSDASRPWWYFLPMLSVFAAELASFWVGGPGAMTFPVPALLWCALTYRPFPTTLLTLAVCVLHTVGIATGVYFFVPEKVHDVFSLRVGITLLALGPLAVVCSRAAGAEVLKRLHRAVNYDFLTDVLARAALMQQGEELLQRLTTQGQSAAVLMLDIDHFKSVNDQYGHATGDLLLIEFARTISAALRPQDLFGRIGGEEFAIVLPQISQEQAHAVAQRLCEVVRQSSFASAHGAPLHVTVSIGLRHVSKLGAPDTLDELLRHADNALYRAKLNGRDRVVIS